MMILDSCEVFGPPCISAWIDRLLRYNRLNPASALCNDYGLLYSSPSSHAIARRYVRMVGGAQAYVKSWQRIGQSYSISTSDVII